MHWSVVQSCVSICPTSSTHSSSHRSTMIITMSALGCSAVVCARLCVLHYPFIITSIHNDYHDECIAVWCSRACPSVRFSPPIHNHSDPEWSSTGVHRSIVQSCVSICTPSSTYSLSYRSRMIVNMSALQYGAVVCVHLCVLLQSFIII